MPSTLINASSGMTVKWKVLDKSDGKTWKRNQRVHESGMFKHNPEDQAGTFYRNMFHWSMPVVDYNNMPLYESGSHKSEFWKDVATGCRMKARSAAWAFLKPNVSLSYYRQHAFNCKDKVCYLQDKKNTTDEGVINIPEYTGILNMQN